MRSQRAGMIAAGVLVVVLAFAATVLLLTRPKPEPTAATAATPTTTGTATTGAAAASTGSTAAGPTATTAATAALAAVSAAGAYLAPPREPFNVDGPADLACTAFVNNGHVLGPSRCGRARLAPTSQLVIWVTGRTPDTKAWTVRIFAYGHGNWSEPLRAVENLPGGTWTGVDVAPITLSPGGRTLLVRFTNQGTGVFLNYDLVRWPRSTGRPTVVAHRGELSHGFERVSQTPAGVVLDDYGANYDDGAPNCCPNRFDHTRIVFRDGLFRYLVRERIPASAVPAR